MKFSKKFFVIIAQIIVMTIAIIVIRGIKPVEINLDFGSQTSDNAEIIDGEYYLKEDLINSGNETTFLSFTGIPLRAGSYTLTIDYIVDETQNVTFSTPVLKNRNDINAGTMLLSKYKYSETYNFEVRYDMTDFNIDIGYNGSGNVNIYGATLYKNHNIYVKFWAILAGMLFFADLYFYWFKRLDKDKKTTCIALAAIWLLSSLSLMIYGLDYGDDMAFHLARVENIVSELKNGNFPVRMGALWEYGWGYAASIMYGEFLLYIAAFFRMLHFDIVYSFKFFVASINLLTVIVAYFSFMYIFKKKNISLILTFVYTTSSYRFLDIYARQAVGEYSALTFLPLVAAGFYGIYNSEEGKLFNRKNILPSVLLGGGVAGVFCSHVISTLMIAVTLFILAAIMFKKTFRWDTIKKLIASIVIFFGLSAFFLIPFMDYFINLPLLVKADYVNDFLYGIQRNGVKLAELFAVFKGLKGNATYTNGVAMHPIYSPGLVLMCAIVIGLILCVRRGTRVTKQIKIMTAIAVIVTFMATDFFPWDFITHLWKGFLLFTQIQFAYRYIDMTLITSTVLLGYLLVYYEDNRDDIKAEFNLAIPTMRGALLILSIVSTLFVFYYNSLYLNSVEEQYIYDSAEIDYVLALDGAEYLLENSQNDKVNTYYRTDGLNSFTPVSREGYTYDVDVEVGESGGYVDFPLYNYSYYRAVADDNSEFKIVQGEENNMVRVILPAGYSGHIKLTYVSPLHWRISEIISLISLIILCVYCYRFYKVEKKVVE